MGDIGNRDYILIWNGTQIIDVFKDAELLTILESADSEISRDKKGHEELQARN